MIEYGIFMLIQCRAIGRAVCLIFSPSSFFLSSGRTFSLLSSFFVRNAMRCTDKAVIVLLAVVYHCGHELATDDDDDDDDGDEEKRNYAYPNASRLLSHNKILLSNDVRATTTTDTRHLVRKREKRKMLDQNSIHRDICMLQKRSTYTKIRLSRRACCSTNGIKTASIDGT